MKILKTIIFYPSDNLHLAIMFTFFYWPAIYIYYYYYIKLKHFYLNSYLQCSVGFIVCKLYALYRSSTNFYLLMFYLFVMYSLQYFLFEICFVWSCFTLYSLLKRKGIINVSLQWSGWLLTFGFIFTMLNAYCYFFLHLTSTKVVNQKLNPSSVILLFLYVHIYYFFEILIYF